MGEKVIDNYIEILKKSSREKYFNISLANQLLYLVDGNIKISNGNIIRSLNPNNFIFFKGNEINSIEWVQDSTILILNLENDTLITCKDYNNTISIDEFDLVKDVILFDYAIMKIISEIIDIYYKVDRLGAVRLQGLKIELIYTLLSRYSNNNGVESSIVNSKNIERLKVIDSYIRENYQNNITLTEVAEEAFFTPQYLAKFFKNSTGFTFLNYLNMYRLNKALPDLINTNKSILEIAMKNGFPNSRSFNKSFFERYGQTPSKYRKLRNSFSDQVNSQDKVKSESLLEISKILKSNLNRYSNLSALDIKVLNKDIDIDISKSKGRIKHNWKNLITVGRAKLIQVDDVRKQIIQIQKEIGFKYIRFHGIFNDDMDVYDEDKDGNPTIHFNHVNEVLDFLYSIGLKPFIEIGFMPKKLALNNNAVILNGLFNVSRPKCIDKWRFLVKEFIRNCINRYGLEEVQQWYFEFWNEPSLFRVDKIQNSDKLSSDLIKENSFWCGSLRQYLEFYKSTYEAIKEIDYDIRVGGPAAEAASLFVDDWFKEYVEFTEKNNCKIDFLSLHFYPKYIINNNLNNGEEDINNYINNILFKVKNLLNQYNLECDVHVTEWNLLGKDNFITNGDNCYKACYIIKNIIDNLDDVFSLGYWTFTDYIETIKGTTKAIFNNNIGLMTSNGIKKAAYNAYVLLNKLGDILIHKDDNLIVTKRGNSIQILVYYCGNTSLDDENVIDYVLNINSLRNGKYEEKIYTLNESSGSSYDFWIRLGKHIDLTDEDVKYLKSKAIMDYSKTEILILDKLKTKVLCKKNEIKFIEYTYKY